MKVILAGGTGQIGNILARQFCARGWEVVTLSRRDLRTRSAQGLSCNRVIRWDGISLDAWCKELDGADVVVNLAGRSVNCRYNQANRNSILDSRLNSTRAIATAIHQATVPPSLWLQSSTATIYSHRYDQPNDDIDGIVGGEEPNAPETWRFSIDVATAWEQAATEIELPNTRTVLLRSAMVMSPDRGGVFDVLLRLVRLRLGGRSGDGKQFVSWIHESDFIAAVDWLIQHTELSGPVNLCSPNPLSNSEFMRILRDSWGVRVGVPAARWMLEVGAMALRTETELILKSRRVVPTRLLQSGFGFQFAHWKNAAQELSQRVRSR